MVMRGEPTPAEAYRIAERIDRGERESAIRRATGSSSGYIRDLVNRTGPSPTDPNRPTAREMVIIRYMAQDLPGPAYTDPEHIAAVMGIEADEARAQMQSLRDKGLLGLEPAVMVDGPPEDRHPTEPRATAMLLRRAGEEGYVPELDDDGEVWLALAGLTVSDETVRIRVEREAAEHILFSAIDATGMPESMGWPAEAPMCIEFSDPVCMGPESDPDTVVCFEGLIITGAEDNGARPVLILTSVGDAVDLRMYHYDPVGRRVSDPDGGEVVDEAARVAANLVGGVLRHIGPRGERLEPVPHEGGASPPDGDGQPRLTWYRIRTQPSE